MPSATDPAGRFVVPHFRPGCRDEPGLIERVGYRNARWEIKPKMSVDPELCAPDEDSLETRRCLLGEETARIPRADGATVLRPAQHWNHSALVDACTNGRTARTGHPDNSPSPVVLPGLPGSPPAESGSGFTSPARDIAARTAQAYCSTGQRSTRPHAWSTGDPPITLCYHVSKTRIRTGQERSQSLVLSGRLLT